MLVTCVLVAVAVVNSSEVNPAQSGSAMKTLGRLVAAIPETRPNMTETEQKAHQAHKAEVDALWIYLVKVQEVIDIGKWNPAYYQNYLTVMQQIAAAGLNTTVLPEEALCWHRASLDLAAEQLIWMTRLVESGKEAKQKLYQARAHFERSRSEYRKALAGLVENAR